MYRNLALVLLLLVITTVAADVQREILDASAYVRAGGKSGSGTVFVHRGAAYVLTAAHVLSDLSDGAGNFEDATLIQMTTDEDGREVEGVTAPAEVLAFDEAEDLAVLRVREEGAFTRGAKFADPEDAMEPGEEVLHCGSRRGLMGANSLTRGVVSFVGRIVDGYVFDQTDAPTSSGSSGGGIFLEDNEEYVGMLTLNAGDTLGLYIPARRIVPWLQDQDLGFLARGW